jgi:ATP-binding cassette subfamily D (ALD) long-chain fatty acid import protein
MHSSLLVFRTVLSLYVANLDGVFVHLHYSARLKLTLPARRIVASLVRAQPRQFFLNILRWLLIAAPATCTNSYLNYIQSKLAIAYRTRLTNEVLKRYLGSEAEGPEGKVYYKLCEYNAVSSDLGSKGWCSESR